MGTKCAPLIADLFSFCYKRDFMMSLSDDTQAEVIEAISSTSRYLDAFLKIDNPYFEGMVSQIYPAELQLNKANISDTKALFLDLFRLKPMTNAMILISTLLIFHFRRRCPPYHFLWCLHLSTYLLCYGV